jgi:hypothetical protein
MNQKRHNPVEISHEEIFAEVVKNRPGVAKAYADLAPEFEIISQLLALRTVCHFYNASPRHSARQYESRWSPMSQWDLLPDLRAMSTRAHRINLKPRPEHNSTRRHKRRPIGRLFLLAKHSKWRARPISAEIMDAEKAQKARKRPKKPVLRKH